MARPEKASIFQRVEGLPIIVVFIVILLLFMYLAPEVFLRPFQYTTFLSTLPPVMLLAIGLTFIIGAGEIDLSFPAVVGFSGFVLAIIFKEGQDWIVSATGTPEGGFLASPLAAELIRWGGVVLALASGVLIGFINGVLVAKIGIPSFIATLGTQFFWYGMATVLSGGKSYALRGAEDSTVWRTLVGRPLVLLERRLDAAAPDPVAVDGADHRLHVVRAQSPPLWRACAVHRRFRTRSRASSALTSSGRRSSSSR